MTETEMIERVNSGRYGTKELLQLLENIQGRDDVNALREALTLRLQAHAPGSKRNKVKVVEDFDPYVDVLARILERLPSVAEGAIHETAELDPELVRAARENVHARMLRQTATGSLTVQDLWWQFVVSGSTSQESYDADSASYHFHEAPPSMYKVRDLATVQAQAAAGLDALASWVDRELRSVRVPAKNGSTKGFRFIKPKVELVLSLYSHFQHLDPAALASTIDAQLAPALQQCAELATAGSRLQQLDADLASSAESSSALHHKPFRSIGCKQLRNVLVSCGLARNVVPLDSRWAGFLVGHGIPVDSNKLGHDPYYLSVEDLIRRALLQLHKAGKRVDVPNLAALDAIVFLLFP